MNIDILCLLHSFKRVPVAERLWRNAVLFPEGLIKMKYGLQNRQITKVSLPRWYIILIHRLPNN